MRLIISYTFLTEGGYRKYVTDVVEMQPHQELANSNEQAFLYIRNHVSSEAVLLGVWGTKQLEPNVTISREEVRGWKGVVEDG